MAPVSTPLSVLHLAVRLDATDLFGVIEWALANARRTGVSLQHLQVPAPQAAGSAWMWLSVGAAGPDLLNLFRHRLESGFDVLQVEQLAEAGQPAEPGGHDGARHAAAPGALLQPFSASGSNTMPSSAAAQVSRTMETKSRANGRSASAVGSTA